MRCDGSVLSGPQHLEMMALIRLVSQGKLCCRTVGVRELAGPTRDGRKVLLCPGLLVLMGLSAGTADRIPAHTAVNTFHKRACACSVPPTSPVSPALLLPLLSGFCCFGLWAP